MKNEKKCKFVAQWSGGKDSTAMIDLILRKGEPLDYIVFCDTLAEFPEMYEYIKKTGSYWRERYGKEVTILKPKETILEALTGIVDEERSEQNGGKIRGAFMPQVSFGGSGKGYCHWRKLSKINTFNNWRKSLNLKPKEVKIYIGINASEKWRMQNSAKNVLYPLIEWEMNDEDCKKYLVERSMENQLYKHFNRTGCGFCPEQSKESKYMLWKYHKQIWAEMVKYENMLRELDKTHEKGVYNPLWFRDKPLSEYEAEFSARAEWELFDNADKTPVSDCFCFI